MTSPLPKTANVQPLKSAEPSILVITQTTARKAVAIRRNICRVDWGLPMLQADVCVLRLPPGFPVVPQYLSHTSVAPQPLTEPDKQLSHIRLFT